MLTFLIVFTVIYLLIGIGVLVYAVSEDAMVLAVPFVPLLLIVAWPYFLVRSAFI